jgi:4-amino-4-deoxy-L-arabinose transferase-like glycosyltransferase
MQKKVVLALLICLGLLLRIRYTDWSKEQYQAQNVAHVKLAGDEVGYDLAVRQLIEKGFYGYAPYAVSKEPNAFTTPGYPLFLAACYRVFGYGMQPPIAQIQAVQIAIDMLSGLLLYWIALRLFRRFWVAAVVISLYYIHPSFIFAPSYLLTETVYGFVSLLFVLQLLRFLERPGALAGIAFGVTFGAAVLIRPAVLPFLALFLGFVTVQAMRRRLSWLGGAGVLAGFLCLMIPWWARNYLVLHRLVLVAEQAGNPLLFGSFPYELNPKIDVSANPAVMQQLALDRIRAGFRIYPLLYLQWYTIGKTWVLIKDVYAGFHGMPKLIVLLHRGAMMLGLAGLVASLKDAQKDLRLIWILILAAGSIIVYLPFAPTSRYLSPVIPLALLGIGYALNEISAIGFKPKDLRGGFRGRRGSIHGPSNGDEGGMNGGSWRHEGGIEEA